MSPPIETTRGWHGRAKISLGKVSINLYPLLDDGWHGVRDRQRNCTRFANPEIVRKFKGTVSSKNQCRVP